MKNRVCLITGATQGIGLAAAIEIAKQDFTVVMTARDQDRGQKAQQQIILKSGNPHVDLLLVDLSSLAAIRGFAVEFKAKYPKLHVLINNAGGVFMDRTVTQDGYETTYAVNHLAYFLLTDLLLDLLKASQPSRIINVSSAAQGSGHIDFDDLQGENAYSGIRAYTQSKLANVLFTYELSRRLAGTNVTANCLHPGVVSTGFAKNNKGIFKFLVTMVGPFLLSPQKGARTTIYLATSPDVEGITGKYFVKCKPASSSPESYNHVIAKKLWEVSEQQVRPK